MDCANPHHNTQLPYQEKTDKTSWPSYRPVGLISATMQVAPGKGHNGVIIIMPHWAHYLENQINTSLSLSISLSLSPSLPLSSIMTLSSSPAIHLLFSVLVSRIQRLPFPWTTEYHSLWSTLPPWLVPPPGAHRHWMSTEGTAGARSDHWWDHWFDEQGPKLHPQPHPLPHQVQQHRVRWSNGDINQDTIHINCHGRYFLSLAIHLIKFRQIFGYEVIRYFSNGYSYCHSKLFRYCNWCWLKINTLSPKILLLYYQCVYTEKQRERERERSPGCFGRDRAEVGSWT